VITRAETQNDEQINDDTAALMLAAGSAQASDAKMKQQLVGSWRNDDRNITFTFTTDGKWLIDGEPWERWDVRSGKLIEIRPGPESERNYTILLLTANDCIIRENGHGDHTGI
jgi:hypothetical protein